MIRPALAILLLALPAAAQSPDGQPADPAADPAAVRVCHEGAAPYDDAPACIGEAANACQDMPGGATTYGIVGCLASEDTTWDALLNEEYGLLRDDLRAADARGTAQDMTRADALRDAQRAWIAFRDADCSLALSIWHDGTIRGPVAAQCRLSHTARRALELRNLRRNGEGSL